MIPFAAKKRDAAGPLPRQLYEQIREMIQKGRLEPGLRLPSTRQLAEMLEVSRNSVSAALEMLASEGYVTTMQGSGCFVAHAPPDRDADNRGEIARIADLPQGDRGPSNLARETSLSAAALTCDDLSLLPFLPDVSQFPRPLWSKLLAAAGLRAPPASRGQWLEQDRLELRHALAEWKGRLRGIVSDPEQVLVTSGNRQSLRVLAQALLEPGDCVWVEDPAPPEVSATLSALGLQVVPVPLDREGFDLDAALALEPRARLAVVSTVQQVPSGLEMSPGRRRRLLDWARRSNAWVADMEWASYFRYGGSSRHSLYYDDYQDSGRCGRVFYISSPAAGVCPNVGLGFLFAPLDLAEPLRRLKTDRFDPVSPSLQLAFAAFVGEGGYAAHLRRMRVLYRQRRDHLAKEIERLFPREFETAIPDIGMHMLARFTPALQTRVREAQLLRDAAAAGLSLAGLSQYCRAAKPEDALVLGFTGADEKRLTAALERLRGILPKA